MNKEQKEEQAQAVKFAYQYGRLTPRQRLSVNWKMVRMLAESAIERRSLSGIWVTFEFIRLLIVPSVAPYVLAGVLTLAALICWGWAMTTGAGVLWLACLALSAAAVLQLRPLVIVETDEVE